MALTPILGLRGTGEFNADFRPTNYRELFTLLEPNGTAPLNALLSMAASEATDDPKFTNFRDEMPDRRMRINNGGGYNTSAGTLQMDTGDPVAFVTAGAMIVNSATGEVMRATANGDPSTYQLTVTRNIGGTSFTIADNDELFVSGFAAQEGSGSPTAVSFDPVTDYNYTQIFKTAWSITNTLKNTYRRIGDAEDEYMKKALSLHMSDIERAMFFGRRLEVNGTTSQPTRYTGGLMNMITNVVDVAAFPTPGVMDEETFDRTLIENVFAWGGKEKVVFAGPRFASLMQSIGKSRWTPSTVSGAYGIRFTRYETFAGDLLFYVHPMFRQVPGMDTTAVILELPSIRYRYLNNRDTHVERDIQGPGEDMVKHQYLTECGLELTQSRVHSIIRGWEELA